MAFNNPRPRRESTTGKPDRGGMDTLIRAEKMTQIAFILPAAVLVGWLSGAGLDKWLHTGWIYLVGIVLGVVAGFVQIFRLIAVAGGEPGSGKPGSGGQTGGHKTGGRPGGVGK
jgi:F0F1-type ATP synthase assembly protein I